MDIHLSGTHLLAFIFKLGSPCAHCVISLTCPTACPVTLISRHFLMFEQLRYFLMYNSRLLLWLSEFSGQIFLLLVYLTGRLKCLMELLVHSRLFVHEHPENIQICPYCLHFQTCLGTLWPILCWSNIHPTKARITLHNFFIFWFPFHNFFKSWLICHNVYKLWVIFHICFQLINNSQTCFKQPLKQGQSKTGFKCRWLIIRGDS